MYKVQLIFSESQNWVSRLIALRDTIVYSREPKITHVSIGLDDIVITIDRNRLNILSYEEYIETSGLLVKATIVTIDIYSLDKLREKLDYYFKSNYRLSYFKTIVWSIVEGDKNPFNCVTVTRDILGTLGFHIPKVWSPLQMYKVLCRR